MYQSHDNLVSPNKAAALNTSSKFQESNGDLISVRKHNYNFMPENGIYYQNNNYMFRPKVAIFRLSQLQFCSKSVLYRSILHHYAIIVIVIT